jgi:hypothetical protein
MSRQHFELIARVLRETPRFRGEPFGEAVAEYRDDLARAFAAELRATNPRFDRERFLRACGVEC